MTNEQYDTRMLELLRERSKAQKALRESEGEIYALCECEARGELWSVELPTSMEAIVKYLRMRELRIKTGGDLPPRRTITK